MRGILKTGINEAGRGVTDAGWLEGSEHQVCIPHPPYRTEVRPVQSG